MMILMTVLDAAGEIMILYKPQLDKAIKTIWTIISTWRLQAKATHIEDSFIYTSIKVGLRKAEGCDHGFE